MPRRRYQYLLQAATPLFPTASIMAFCLAANRLLCGPQRHTWSTSPGLLRDLPRAYLLPPLKLEAIEGV